MSTATALPSDPTKLRAGTVDLTPLDFDACEGYGETWTYHAPFECPDCGTISTPHGEEECPECGAYAFEEGPMMNVLWPLPDGANPDPADLVGTPMCLVELWDGGLQPAAYHLGLCGAGMDFSWGIARAYVQLGYLPPACLDLPRMAGMEWNDRTRPVVEACLRSQRITCEWARGRIAKLEEVRAWLENGGK